MENDSSPKQGVKISDKVIHARADIRIESIENAPQDYTVALQSPKLVEQDSQSLEDAAEKERAAEMQVWWDEAISRNMNLPDGYQSVAVLLIKWDDELDELKTRKEVEELDDVFRDLFNFQTQIVDLNVSSKPQHQISRYISAFVEKHDGPNNLMVVYYSGHGLWREDLRHLELTGSIKNNDRGFRNEARANWEKAEEALRSDDIEGDVLTILDTCYSSNVTKSGNEDTRTFELLSACAYDTTTASPGPNSFTRALIDALKELLKETKDRSFSTFYLNQRILMNPNRRDTPSQLWFRLKHHERHIRLAPLKPQKDRSRPPALLALPRGYLTLRFAIRDESLNREQIDFLTKNLSQVFSNKQLLGLRRIDWIGLKPARTTHFGRAALAMFAIAQWKKVVNKKRNARLGEEQYKKSVDDARLPLDMSLQGSDSFSSSPSRKRLRNSGALQPNAKKGLLATNFTPIGSPSPPISDVSVWLEETGGMDGTGF